MNEIDKKLDKIYNYLKYFADDMLYDRDEIITYNLGTIAYAAFMIIAGIAVILKMREISIISVACGLFAYIIMVIGLLKLKKERRVLVEKYKKWLKEELEEKEENE